MPTSIRIGPTSVGALFVPQATYKTAFVRTSPGRPGSLDPVGFGFLVGVVMVIPLFAVAGFRSLSDAEAAS